MGHDAGKYRLLIGTYTKGSSRGIYTLAMDGATGALSGPELAAEAPNPTFIALSPDGGLLYAVCAGDSWASSFRVDAATGLLEPIQQAAAGPGPTPCHIAVDPTGRIAIAANYHLALAAVIPLGGDGTIGTPRVVSHSGKGVHPSRQASAHVHSANFSPDARHAIVCDLGLDRIYTYRLDHERVALLPGDPPYIESSPGAGPRHLAFGRGGRHAYAINELDNTIVAYDYLPPNGGLVRLQAVSVLPAGYRGEATAAEVRVHPSGRFVYGSSRGPDTIAVFAVHETTGALTPVEVVPCGGKGPRSFALSPDGLWLACAHQDSGTVCSFRVDGPTGRLFRVPGSVEVPMPVCAVFLR
jgi:6-phosphogluconolactonase